MLLLSGTDIKRSQRKKMLEKRKMQRAEREAFNYVTWTQVEKWNTSDKGNHDHKQNSEQDGKDTPSVKIFHSNSTYAGSDVVSMCVQTLSSTLMPYWTAAVKKPLSQRMFSGR